MGPNVSRTFEKNERKARSGELPGMDELAELTRPGLSGGWDKPFFQQKGDECWRIPQRLHHPLVPKGKDY